MSNKKPDPVDTALGCMALSLAFGITVFTAVLAIAALVDIFF